MMHRLLLTAMALMGFIATTEIFAYELTTHQRLSQAAVDESVLSKNPTVLQDLGLDSAVAPSLVLDGRPISIRELIGIGAQREDTLTSTRPIHHFFDPTRAGDTNNGALRLPVPATPTYSSPTWALADRGPVNGQEYSFRNARSYLMNALTLGTKAERETAFTKTFQTLGMVIHHLQDMAQPQHVRNDLHCKESFCRPFFHNPSAYEDYTEKRFGALGSIPEITGYPSVFTGANATRISTPRALWYTGDGKGIAEFTNRNFVSAGTNFRYEGKALPDAFYGYPSPSPNANSVTIAQAYAARRDGQTLPPQLAEFCGPSTTCVIEFYATSGIDALTGLPVNNLKASSLSIFDWDLKGRPVSLTTGDGSTQFSSERLFSLNSFNFDAATDILLRRAVGYSAGLIDYFFRGKLEVEGKGDDQILVKNATKEAMKGDFGLYYDDAQDIRYPVVITACKVGDVDVAVEGGKCKGAELAAANPNPGTPLEVTFTRPADPAPKAQDAFMLVFSGDLGEEKASAGNVGAVVGKSLNVPYNGVLWVAGQNSTGEVVYFKVDKGGIAVVPLGAGGPFQSVSASGKSAEQLARGDRAYSFKQVEFTTGNAGNLIHKTIAVALKGDGGNQSLLLDSTGNAFSLRNGTAWLAKSSDPAIGAFEFRLQPEIYFGISRQASISFTRRYTNTEGTISQTSGVFQLPVLPSTTEYNYTGFFSGQLIVNSDGTLIYPLGNAGLNRNGVRITLAASPSASLFELPKNTSSVAKDPTIAIREVRGECSIDLTLANGVAVKKTAPVSYVERQQGEELLDVVTMIDGYINGAIVSYEIRTRTRALDYYLLESCTVGDFDYSTNPARYKWYDKESQKRRKIGRRTIDSVFPTGAFQYVVWDVYKLQPGTVQPWCSNTMLYPGMYVNSEFEYFYQGYAPCPTDVPASEYVGRNVDYETGVTRQLVYRALTDRAADAVYTEEQNNANVYTNNLKFRGQLLPNIEGVFVADVSPIGEIFVASTDMSVLVHEPKASNMPVLTRGLIPSGIVKLLAAIWM